jgi:hypothetical protein
MCSRFTSSTPLQTGVEQSPQPTVHVIRARDGYQTPDVRRTELILGPTGPFRSLIVRYMAEAASTKYIAKDLVKVRGDIAKFFRFVVLDLRIEDIDAIRPSTITRYVERQRAEGYLTFLFLGRLATFFTWVISLELYDHGNPVVNRIHRPMMMAQRGASNSKH